MIWIYMAAAGAAGAMVWRMVRTQGAARRKQLMAAGISAEWEAIRTFRRAGIRAMGRLREEAGWKRLVTLLDNTMWARCAADALGDFGDRRSVAPLLAAYPRYAKQMDGRFPPDVPTDDLSMRAIGCQR